MKTKRLFALATALVLLVLCTLPVVAASTDASAPPDGEAVQSDSAADSDSELNPATPVAISDTDVETPLVLEGEEIQETYDDPAFQETEKQPTSTSGNTPYFIGAAIAVLVFAGVALYCRANGNK